MAYLRISGELINRKESAKPHHEQGQIYGHERAIGMTKAPNAKHYNPSPEYLRSLIKAAGLTQEQAAERIGISARAMRSYLSRREGNMAPYTVQFALECLARYELADGSS